MQSNGLILGAITKLTGSRRSSVSSAGTGVSTEAADDTTEIEDPVLSVAYSALIDVEGEKHQLLVTLHRPYIETNNKKYYVKYTLIATKAAIEFIDHVKATLAVNDDNVNNTALQQSILEDLDHLNPDLYTNLYIDLKQGLKKSKGKGKANTKLKPKPKATASTRSASPLPRCRDMQGDGATTPTPATGSKKAPLASARQISNTSHDNSNSQVSLNRVSDSRIMITTTRMTWPSN
ncbi:hypothetical protein ACHAPU_006547 [Fusarium lateritium]